MEILRYSAIANFGVPIDNPEDLANTDRLKKLMDAYGVVPEPIGETLVDITPYYWQNHAFHYFLSRKDADSPAVVELLSRELGAATYLLGVVASGGVFSKTNVRKIEIPTMQEAMAVTGGSPRFSDQFCVHELIIRN